MDNEVAMTAVGPGAHGIRVRVPAVVVAVALVFTALFLVQHRAEAAPAAAVAAVALPAAGAAPQINIAQFVCPILLSIRAAFASSPFFAVVVGALNPILIAFGCIPSTGG